MSNLDDSIDRIRQVAESLGCKRKKEHLVYHEQISAPYLRFLRSMARSALLVISGSTDLSRRLNNLEKVLTELSHNDFDSLKSFLKDDSSENCLVLSQSDFDSLAKLIEHHKKMEIESQIALSEMFTTSVISCFEVYLQDLVYEILIHYPDTLHSSKKTITYDKILKYSSMDTLISYIAKLEASESTKGRVKDYLPKIAKRFGINSIDELINLGVVQCVDRISSIRNVIVHNNGVVDSDYLRRYPESGFQEGDCIELNLPEVASMLETIRLTTGIIENSVTQKFCNIATIEWSEQAKMYMEYVLDLEDLSI